MVGTKPLTNIHLDSSEGPKLCHPPLNLNLGTQEGGDLVCLAAWCSERKMGRVQGSWIRTLLGIFPRPWPLTRGTSTTPV